MRIKSDQGVEALALARTDLAHDLEDLTADRAAAPPHPAILALVHLLARREAQRIWRERLEEGESTKAD
mgnify:CR=1 FL=1